MNLPRLVFLALIAFAVSAGGQPKSLRVPARAPQAALKTFKLAKGFQIELVASEPLIRDPVAIDFDAQGRMYVVEYPEFNKYSFKPGVQVSSGVKRLEDTNGDGKYDKATKFLDRIPMATAVACYNGGVFVGAAPQLLFCKDTTGDGKADVRQVVLSGFGRDFAGGGLLNSIRWGMDNRFHIATGFAGGNVRQTARPGDAPVSVRGRGLILDPRTRTIEATSGGGQHGLGMDDWGNKFLCSNVNPIQLLMYDARYMARNPYFAPPAAAINIHAEGPLAKLHRISPLEPWRVIRSKRIVRADDEGRMPGGLFTSASGISIFRGSAWTKDHPGTLFVGEVANNLVYRAKLTARGVGQVAQRIDQKQEFLASSDIWFRPVQFANGPDGNLYVVDMYRELIEGAAFVPRDVLKNLDPSSGTDRGRIYRVVWTKNKSQWTPPTLHLATTAKLVSLLKHPNGWHRDTASRLLYEKRDPNAVQLLRKLLRESKSSLTTAHALHALQGLGKLTADDVLPYVSNSDVRLAKVAIRLAEPFLGKSPQLDAKVLERLDDSNIGVRFQLAFSLGAGSFPQHRAGLVKLLKRDAGDKWMRAAVQSSLLNDAGDVLLALMGDRTFRRSQHGQIALRRLASQIGARNRPREIALFVKALQLVPAAESATRTMITRGLFEYANDELRKRFADQKQLDRVVQDLVKQARKTATDKMASIRQRGEAIRTLSLTRFSDPGIRQLFVGLLRSGNPERIHRACLDTLAKLTDPGVAKLILADGWNHLGPRLRQRAVEVLLSRSVWIQQALAAIKQGKIHRGEVSAARLSILANHSEAAIRAMAAELLSKMRQPLRQEVIKAYQSALKLKGNLRRGKQVFEQTCSACHRRKDRRIVAGDLLDLTGKPSESILVNILDPNQAVKPKYVTYLLEKTDGRVLTGMIIEETETSLRIQQIDGKAVTVLRVAVRSIKTSGKSFMPEGLEKKINHQAMADLLTFLRSNP